MYTNKPPIVLRLIAGIMFWLAAAASADSAVRKTLREHNITGSYADHIVECFAQGAQHDLPRDLLHARLQEGIVKKASAEALAAALRHRLDTLIAAQQILAEAAHEHRRDAVADACLETVAHALESGLTADVFAGLFGRERGALSHRMQAIVEAGEWMHLAAVDAESIRIFMHDCRDRNLRRMETMRAARFWIQQHREGADSKDIRQRLWSTRRSGHDGGVPRENGARRFRNRSPMP